MVSFAESRGLDSLAPEHTAMETLLTVTGRDVLFAHWPVEPAVLEPMVPAPLDVDTFDDSAWVSALAHETPAITPGSLTLPEGMQPGFPQLNFRTYVTRNGEPGVYFLSLDSGRRLPAMVGRRLFGLPFHHARMRLTRSGDAVTFRSHRDSGDGPPAVFQARYGPAGESYQASPGSLEAFCVEQFRYYLPAPEDRRIDAVRRVATSGGDMLVGTIDRKPWTLRPASATIRGNTLFEAVGLPEPATDPVVQYSPGFEMAVSPLESVTD